jgi:hypothetical protein
MLISHPGHAEQPSSDAEERYRAAHVAMDNGKWEDARSLLRALFDESHTYDVAGSLGEVEYQMGRYGSSANYIAFAIANLPPHEKADRLRTVLHGLQALVGIVHLSLKGDGVDLFIDGEPVPLSRGAKDIYIDEGTHTLTARRGNHSVDRVVQISSGAETTAAFEFPESDRQNDARLRRATRLKEPDSGPRREVETSRAKEVVVISGSALAVIGLGAGIGFGLASNSAESDARGTVKTLPRSACVSNPGSVACESAESAYDRQRRNATIANVGFAVGAIAAVATLGAVFLWPNDAQHDTNSGGVRAAAVLAPGLLGLTVGGGF